MLNSNAIRCFATGLALVAAIIGASPAKSATPPDTLVVAAAIDDIITLDPGVVLEVFTGEILGQTYDRLVRFGIDDPSKLKGDVAESWTISQDGKTFIFKLRSGVVFASGNPLTAEDFAFAIQRTVKLDKSPAFFMTQLGLTKDNVTERVIALPDGTLSLTTDKAYAPNFVLNCMAVNSASAIDKKVVLEHEKNGDLGSAWLANNYAGSGPMKLRDWRANEIVVLERNDKYYGAKAKLSRVIYRHVPESATQRLLLESGDIDIARNLEPGDLEAIAKDERFAAKSTLSGTMFYISLNMKNPVFTKPEVREAFKYLVDYDAIGSTLLKGIGVIHQEFEPTGVPGATGQRPYKLDVAKAKALLAKAGYPNGFTVTFDVRTGQPLTGIAEAFQQTAAQAGITLQIVPGNGKQVLTKYRARKHDIYIGDWSLKYQDPHSNADTFASTPDPSDDAKVKTVAWRNGWDNREVTNKTAGALLQTDVAKRVAIYHDILDEFNKDSPFIMLYQPKDSAVMSKKVRNVVLGPIPFCNLLYMATKI